MKRTLILIAIATLAACSGGGGHTNNGETVEPEDGQAVIQYPDGSTETEEVTLTYDCDDGRKLIIGHDRWRYDEGEWQTGEPPLWTECKPIG